MQREREIGMVKLKTILGIAILLAIVYSAAKVIAPVFGNYQLKDKMYEEARFAQTNNRTPDQLKDIIFAEGQSDGLPLRREEIRVEMTPSKTLISADYRVTVDLHVYQLQLHFRPSSSD